MTSTTLDYSSWLFQLICVLAIVYLAVGLTQPALVKAGKRSTVAIIAAAVMLLAATGFYFVASTLPGGEDTLPEVNAEQSQQPAPQP